MFVFIGLAATAPYSVEIKGPFIAWGTPIRHVGHILNYVVRVKSATGDSRSIAKNETSFYHILVREDIPTDLGGDTSVIVQVSDRYLYTYILHLLYKYNIYLNTIHTYLNTLYTF